MIFHWCLQVLIITVLIAWQAGLLWWRWAHLLIYSYCHCFPLSRPQDGYWLALWTLVCIFLSSESSSFLPSTTEDEDLIIPGTNSHQNRCRGTTEHVWGKSDPWCLISTSESSSEALAPVLSEAVWDALRKEKGHQFSRLSQCTRRCHFRKENCWGYGTRDISHRHEDIRLAEETLASIFGQVSYFMGCEPLAKVSWEYTFAATSVCLIEVTCSLFKHICSQKERLLSMEFVLMLCKMVFSISLWAVAFGLMGKKRICANNSSLLNCNFLHAVQTTQTL